MNEGEITGEAEIRTLPDTNENTGNNEVLSIEDLARTRRRQQVRQACQQCRRRKIKCDEIRSVCRPCLKARLACTYELPPGQTRAQAMLESQNRLQDELHAHTSLIHSLRCVDANSSAHILSHLRLGDYDSVLLGADLALRSHSPGDRVYPWEEIDERQRRIMPGRDSLPSIDAFLPMRLEGALYPQPERVPERVTGFSQRYPPISIPPRDMPASIAVVESSQVQKFHR